MKSLSASFWRPGVTANALVALALAAAAFAAPKAVRYAERAEEEMLLLQVRLRHSLLVEVLPAYPTEDGLLLPLGQIVRALELRIDVDTSTGRAEGFIVSKDRRFELDAASAQVRAAGRFETFAPSFVEVHREDIYIDTGLLTRYLPIDLVVDLRAALVRIIPREPLPIELRQARRARAGEFSASTADEMLPRVEVPYGPVTAPFIDPTIQVELAPSATGSYRAAGQYSLFAASELLFLESNLHLSGTDDKPLSAARLSLGRRDPGGRLLGPLRAREVLVGDVLHPGLELVQFAQSGPGFLVSNFPLHRPSRFDRHTFTGDLPPGWEVELYRNDALIAYQESRADGRYEFRDVPLYFGRNSFRLVFYGRFGEKREERREFEVDQTMTPRGKLYYRLVANDPMKGTLIDPVHPPDSPFLGPRSLAEVEFGVTRRLSLRGGTATLESGGDRHQYAFGGVRAYWRNVFASGDFVSDREGGAVWQTSVRTRLGWTTFSVQQAQFQRGFDSEAIISFGELDRRTTFLVEGRVPGGFLPIMPFQLEARRDHLAHGGTLDRLRGRVSIYDRGVAATNELTSTSARSEGLDARSVHGTLRVSKYLPSFALRGEVGYTLEPARQLASFSLSADRRLGNDYILGFGITRAVENGTTNYVLSFNKQKGAFGLGFTLDYRQSGDLRAFVSLNAGLAHDSETGWQSSARSTANMGAVSANVFLDANESGAPDPGESPIPDVEFAVNRSLTEARTDANGMAYIGPLPGHQQVDLSLVTRTLEDPLWLVKQPALRIVPRPGRVMKINFPVVSSGEVTGTVYMDPGDGAFEAAGVELELVDDAGVVHHRVRTAYDGFYDIAGILPGRYELRVSPAQLERLNLLDTPKRELRVPSSGKIIDGLDFVLQTESVPHQEGAGSPEPELTLPEPRIKLEPSQVTPPASTTAAPRAAARERSSLSRVSAIPLPAPEWTGRAASFAVQLASFRDREVAGREAARLQQALGHPAFVIEVNLVRKGVWYRVLGGEFAKAEEAHEFRELLRRKGTEVGLVYHLTPADAAVRSTVLRTAISGSAAHGIYVVQVSSYRDREAAERDAAGRRTNLSRPVHVVTVDLEERGIWHRVLVGDFASEREAGAFRANLMESGLPVGPVYRIEKSRHPGD